MKSLALIVLLAAPAAYADASKEAAPSSRKLSREWQVDSRLFVADKDAPALHKGATDAAHRPALKLDK